MEINKQKEYIKKLTDIAMGPIQCANNFLNQTTKQYTPGKRTDPSKFQICDHITVVPNQIIFELDATSYNSNFIIAQKIINVLEQVGAPYYIYSSGGKGIHIEMFFAKPNFTNTEIKTLFTEALSFNLSFKDIRIWLFNKIIEESGINKDIVGSGKTIDTNAIMFDDLNNKTRLIRCVGGRKMFYNKITEETTTFYKTYIPKDMFTSKQIKEDNIENINYPTELKTYQIDENEFGQFLFNYINYCNDNKKIKLEKIDLKKTGGYLNLESIKRIREGLGQGQRNLGAQILAIAMANDKIGKDDRIAIMKDYVSKCSQVGDRFTIEEAMGWITWVESQPDIFWNCSLVDNAGLHDAALCEVCLKKHKDAINFLQQVTLLDQIKEVLDFEIIGEDENKMLMFLLMLSKDFPSKTGKPGWAVIGDPMSQNIILSADSSSGKTYMTKKILDIFGEKDQDYFIISRTTKNAINYYTDQNMDGKIIFIEELQGLDDNTQQLRVWMSEGELNLNTVEKVRNEDGIEVNAQVKKKTVGQPVFITNQAEGKIEDQLNNRSWVLGLDVSGEQTQKILDFQDKLDMGTIKIDETKKRKIKDALKQLRPYHFRIDFLDNSFLKIPTNDVRSRRDYQKFKTLIKCSAYLHQKQREIIIENGKEYIKCDIKDYEIAKKYAENILGATFSGLTTAQIDLINFLKKQPWNQEFLISDIMRNLGKTQPYWFGQLSQLVDLGYLNCDRQGPGKSNIYTLNLYRVINIINLPSGDEIKRHLQTNIDIAVSEPIMRVSPQLNGDKKNVPTSVIADNTILPVTPKNSKITDFEGIANLGNAEELLFHQPKQKSFSYTPDLVIGLDIRKHILEYMNHSREHLIKIDNLIEKWPDKQDEIFAAIKILELDGVIYKKGNSIILL